MMHFWRRLAKEELQKFSDVVYTQISQTENAKEGPLAFAEAPRPVDGPLAHPNAAVAQIGENLL